jgi:cytochrome d ubiquinol oxidase subunit II
MFDYETLRLIWWVLLGVLLIGFAVMDGFDFGTAALLPFVAKTDMEKRIALTTIGPVWEGNQVWFILGGGTIFAAWPALYAASFSGFYLAMFLVLLPLILRPVALKFRSKMQSPLWRSTWDWIFFSSGIVPALVFGVAFGNLFLGVPYNFDNDLRFSSEITLFSLLSPFALLFGLVSLSMMVLHGASWLNLKTEGPVKTRCYALMPYAAVTYMVLFAAAGLWLATHTGYHITSVMDHNGPSNPFLKTVAVYEGGWFTNYANNPWMWIAPALAFGGAALSILLRARPLAAFVCTAFVPFGTIASAGLGLFPFLLPSSTNPSVSLTVWDASASKLTLGVMLVVTAVILPIVATYTAWAYRVMRGPVSAESITADSKSAY